MFKIMRGAAPAGLAALALTLASPAQAEGPKIYLGVQGSLLQSWTTISRGSRAAVRTAFHSPAAISPIRIAVGAGGSGLMLK